MPKAAPLKVLFFETVDSETNLPIVVEKVRSTVKSNSILLLDGVVGAGKTTFTRLLCESFGLKAVQSPTYAIHQRYGNSAITIDHLDLYRLNNEEEIETAGIWELLLEVNNLIIVEWSEKMTGDWLPLNRDAFRLTIALDGDNRTYQFVQLN